MSMMRKCDACKQPIPQRQYVEVSLRILHPDRNEMQDPIEQVEGDYCDGCVASGEAIVDLVSGLTKYKGLESEKKKGSRK